MKKNIYVIIGVLVLTLLIVGSFKFVEYYVQKKNETPKEFLNKNFVDRKMYLTDSLYLSVLLKEMRRKRVFLYNPTYFNEKSIFIIDTIIYDSKHNKLAFWGICESTYPHPTESKYIYEASGYYAFRDKITNNLRLSLAFDFNIGRFDYNDLKEYFIREFLYKKHKKFVNKDSKPRYNWNDIRMWYGADWDDVLIENSYSFEKGKLVKYTPQDFR